MFGVGGVGGYALEALARAGVGRLAAVDGDAFEESNLNRQLLCTTATVGLRKAEVAAERVTLIDPAIDVRPLDVFVTPENVAMVFDRAECQYIIDAVDNVTAKLAVIAEAKRRGLYVVSCMGTGNRLDPTRFRVTDISETRGCPLARVMRRELKVRGFSVDAVWSDEEPVPVGGRTPASVSFVPGAAGLTLCAAVVRKILNKK